MVKANFYENCISQNLSWSSKKWKKGFDWLSKNVVFAFLDENKFAVGCNVLACMDIRTNSKLNEAVQMLKIQIFDIKLSNFLLFGVVNVKK